MKSVALFFLDILKGASNEKENLRQTLRKISAHPIKAIAAFFAAPFLIIRVALKVNNPIRRAIAVTGLILSILLAYLAGTFLGSLIGSTLIMTHIGFLTGIGFFIGVMSSVILSVSFSIFVLNSVSFLFLKMSTQEVADYLNDISS